MAIPHAIKTALLNWAHLLWHLYNSLIFSLICIYYYLLQTIEQANKTCDLIQAPMLTNPIIDNHTNGFISPDKNPSLSRQQFTSNRNEYIRIPKHIALAFTNEANCLDLESIARLLCWCKQLSIPFITIYDDLGKLKLKQKELFKQFEMKTKSLGCGDKQVDKIDGLNIISKPDGRGKFLSDIKKLISENNNSDDINVNKVQNRIGWLSKDPELLISFGYPLCLYGFPPWQLRLTEILTIPTHRNLPQRVFIDCLKRYSRISQREGA